MAIQASNKKLQSYLELKTITPALHAKLMRKKEVYTERLKIINAILAKESSPSKEKSSGTRNSEVV